MGGPENFKKNDQKIIDVFYTGLNYAESMKRTHRLLTDDEQLRVLNTSLEEDLARVTAEAQRLRWQNELLQAENVQLCASAQEWREKAQRNTTTERTSSTDLLDPEGYYKALGIDPRLVKTLPPDKFERLLASIYRAYSLVFHPDTGGDKEAMKALNAAYDFLKDPQNRGTYGR